MFFANRGTDTENCFISNNTIIYCCISIAILRKKWLHVVYINVYHFVLNFVYQLIPKHFDLDLQLQSAFYFHEIRLWINDTKLLYRYLLIRYRYSRRLVDQPYSKLTEPSWSWPLWPNWFAASGLACRWAR